MLPGFRFLFAAILLSISLLVFGVGAAALLRATHEEFVANPSWRNGPQERVFAQATEPAQPVLAVLRAEPEPAPTAPSLRDQIPTIGLPDVEVQPSDFMPAEASSEPAVQVAETRPTGPAADEPAKPELAAAPPADAPAETSPVATGAAPPPTAPIVASTLEPADTIVSPPPAEAETATTKVAALPDPATASEKAPPPKAKAASTAPETAAKRRAQRQKKRHRIVRRPPPPPVQQTYDPFAQPQPAFAAATTTRKR